MQQNKKIRSFLNDTYFNNNRMKNSFIELLRYILITIIMALNIYDCMQNKDGDYEKTYARFLVINFSVSCFAIISGYFNKDNIRHTFKLFLLFCFYTVINIIFIILFQETAIAINKDYAGARNILMYDFIKVWTQQWWFLFSLMLVYLASNAISKLIDYLDPKIFVIIFSFILLILFNVNVSRPFIGELGGYDVKFYIIGVDIIKWSVPLGMFFALGVFLRKHWNAKAYFKQVKNHKILKQVSYYGSLVLIIVVSYLLLINLPNINTDRLWNKKTPWDTLCCLMGISLFLIFRDIEINVKFINKLLVFLGSMTPTMYLMHGFIHYQFIHWEFANIGVNPLNVFIMFLVPNVLAILIGPWINLLINKCYCLLIKRNNN